MPERPIGRIMWFALIAMMLVGAGGRASASPPAGTCFAVRPAVSDRRPPVSLDCRGTPVGYERAALWLRLPGESPLPARDTALLVHSTRFDRLTVIFVFADGSHEVQEVRRGAFGDHWRVGGQIEFRPRV